MIIVMKSSATTAQVDHVVARVKSLGFDTHLSVGEERTIIGIIGDERPVDDDAFSLMEGVEKTVRVLTKYKLASRDFHPQNTIVHIGTVAIGGNQVVALAGPCAIESESQIMAAAQAVKKAGASVIRAGAYKPRTSPYSFQGLGEEGLKLLAQARLATELPVVTEVMSSEQVDIVAKYTDAFQIGTRNMQNYNLLCAVGSTDKPVILKRGMMSKLEELLMSAEYILSRGNDQVILCERGIRTFETATRNTLDLSAVPVLKQLSHLPVIVDPSHAAGDWHYVPSLSLAAIAVGADGLLIEVHPDPEHALSDGAQSLTPERFSTLMNNVRAVAAAVGREVA